MDKTQDIPTKKSPTEKVPEETIREADVAVEASSTSAELSNDGVSQTEGGPEDDRPSRGRSETSGGSGGSGPFKPGKSTDEEESKKVSMVFRSDTIQNMDYLREATGIDNRTQLTADAIALAAWYVARRSEGARVYAEYENGERESLFIPRF